MVEQAGRRALPIARYLLCALAAALVAACNGGGGSGAQANSSGPSLSGSPAQQASVGHLYSFRPVVNGGRITTGTNVGFSIANKPGWANFSVANGQLSGTPTSADIGTYPNISITANSGASSVALPPFTITVAPSGQVTLNWEAPTTNTDGSPISDLAGYTISYGTDASALDQTVTVDNPTTTVYTMQNLASGTWYFAVGAYTSTGERSALTSVLSTTVE
jgi:hypothetical protein